MLAMPAHGRGDLGIDTGIVAGVPEEPALNRRLRRGKAHSKAHGLLLLHAATAVLPCGRPGSPQESMVGGGRVAGTGALLLARRPCS